jgi:hypothetical protein
MMERLRGLASIGAAAVLIAGLGACGGGSSSPTAAPTPTPTPTPPSPRVVSSGGGLSLQAGYVGRAPFTTTLAGSLSATVDWTFTTNDIDVALVGGNCSFDQLQASQCPILAISASTTAKPETIRADGVAAGDYTLFIENTGPGDETLSYQVVLTPSATGAVPPSASSQSHSVSLGRKRAPVGVVELH